MSVNYDRPIGERPFGLRLDTLVRLRWLAVGGQVLMLGGVYWGLGFDLPIVPALTILALTSAINVALGLRHPTTRRLDDRAAGWMLAYDILQLALLLYLTGGIANPFCVLLLAPVLISATALSPRTTLALGALAVVSMTIISIQYHPLPWFPGERANIPAFYRAGIWLSLLVSVVFIGSYAWRIAEERSELSDALAATELVLAREQHLSALDGLAAAAAHELGTPLATIALVVRELERELPGDGTHADDIRLLREQTERCRSILGTLATLQAGDAPFDRMPLPLLLEEVVAPHRPFGIKIDVDLQAERANEPVIARNPAILYGLGNLVENAVDYARERVRVSARWDTESVIIGIADDGPGFSSAVIDRIGEPYVTTHGTRRSRPAAEGAPGLGLGFFIAKTLLERTGAAVDVENRPGEGANVWVRWPRRELEQTAGIVPPRSSFTPADAPDLTTNPAGSKISASLPLHARFTAPPQRR
jgi:two-component system sensor histidine kinase RegB